MLLLFCHSMQSQRRSQDREMNKKKHKSQCILSNKTVGILRDNLMHTIKNGESVKKLTIYTYI